MRQSTPWLETIPKAYGQKLNSKGYKFGDEVTLVQDHGGHCRTGYVVGHTATRCTVVFTPVHMLFERLSVVSVPNSAIRFTRDLLLLGRHSVHIRSNLCQPSVTRPDQSSVLGVLLCDELWEFISAFDRGGDMIRLTNTCRSLVVAGKPENTTSVFTSMVFIVMAGYCMTSRSSSVLT